VAVLSRTLVIPIREARRGTSLSECARLLADKAPITLARLCYDCA
jgi:hypothetical protein